MGVRVNRGFTRQGSADREVDTTGGGPFSCRDTAPRAGNDILIGGLGADTLTGDACQFFCQDTITDFAAGAGPGDVVRVDQTLFADFASIIATAQQVGSDTDITYDVNNKIVFDLGDARQLASDDFLFVR